MTMPLPRLCLFGCLVLAGIASGGSARADSDCPPGTYKFLNGDRTRCVPYANGGPSQPGPAAPRSTITGPSGPGGGSSGTPLSAPAR